MLQKACFCHRKHPFWGFLGMFLQDFTKTQNLMLLNISVLQSKLCIFVFCIFAFCILQMRTCSRSAIETKFHCAHLLAALHFCVLHFASVFIVYRLFAIETEDASPNVIVKGHLGIVPFIRFSYFS